MRSIGVFGEPVCTCRLGLFHRRKVATFVLVPRVLICFVVQQTVQTSCGGNRFVCMQVCVHVLVRGTVQLGPNRERGLGHPERRHSTALGPTGLKEWGISSNLNTKSQQYRGNSPAGPIVGSPATRQEPGWDHQTGETSAGQNGAN